MARTLAALARDESDTYVRDEEVDCRDLLAKRCFSKRGQTWCVMVLWVGCADGSIGCVTKRCDE